MLALSSSRRQSQKQPLRPHRTPFEAFSSLAGSGSSAAILQGRASRRVASDVEVTRNRGGAIEQVRIGRWRTLTAAPQRRLAEVRELSCNRVAVKIERLADGGTHPTSEIWQLYDCQGRLLAAMQCSADGRFAMLSNYQTRQACRLVRNGRNELETAESWTI
jgi:hypothetical protein